MSMEQETYEKDLQFINVGNKDAAYSRYVHHHEECGGTGMF